MENILTRTFDGEAYLSNNDDIRESDALLSTATSEPHHYEHTLNLVTTFAGDTLSGSRLDVHDAGMDSFYNCAIDQDTATSAGQEPIIAYNDSPMNMGIGFVSPSDSCKSLLSFAFDFGAPRPPPGPSFFAAPPSRAISNDNDSPAYEGDLLHYAVAASTSPSSSLSLSECHLNVAPPARTLDHTSSVLENAQIRSSPTSFAALELPLQSLIRASNLGFQGGAAAHVPSYERHVPHANSYQAYVPHRSLNKRNVSRVTSHPYVRSSNGLYATHAPRAVSYPEPVDLKVYSPHSLPLPLLEQTPIAAPPVSIVSRSVSPPDYIEKLYSISMEELHQDIYIRGSRTGSTLIGSSIDYGDGCRLDLLLLKDYRQLPGHHELAFPSGTLTQKSSYRYQFRGYPQYTRQVNVRQMTGGHPQPPTRGFLATCAAREMKRFIKKYESEERKSFPYALDQLWLRSIDLRSRSSLQPRIWLRN